jgi:hypothetical protein
MIRIFMERIIARMRAMLDDKIVSCLTEWRGLALHTLHASAGLARRAKPAL